ncbi:MAG: ACT domain-containing protein [Alphaproteobacteria bacterium]|jgi:glycine cleavage system transcriptional repressor|nr:ACT domain-containing protein [Rhodospirillaceae bacterium]MBT6512567.1 ACT domain-containing protein [Rhodospirillaceae bacterium]MBT7614798.1 ACT domain-containing protein [Rhodospirillaceae bacterium]MBT7648667.1 ACT domain-containing protein [Rhodospirillaceae bacterium]MDG2483289.1 ACT domain-containing protein [Alphaproteobacteria bacterium]
MATNTLISVICHDRSGLVADLAGLLFNLNVNLSDTTFAVLGDAAEFTCLAEIPDGLTLDSVRGDIESLSGLKDAQVTVATFDMKPVHDDSGHITHRIEIDGRDGPGIIARLAEVFGQFGANIVRMNSERIPEKGHDRYVTRFSVYIPERRADVCLATVANTAGELRMTFRFDAVES